jgi:hypothetical protein
MAIAKKQHKNQDTIRHPEPVKISQQSSRIGVQAIPTGEVRHITAVRLGKVSGEIFCRDASRRRELGLPRLPDPETDFIEELRA